MILWVLYSVVIPLISSWACANCLVVQRSARTAHQSHHHHATRKPSELKYAKSHHVTVEQNLRTIHRPDIALHLDHGDSHLQYRSDPRPPLILNRYELLEPIGSGGFATVYQLWDREEREYKAAKIQRSSASLLTEWTVSESLRHQWFPHHYTKHCMQYNQWIRLHNVDVLIMERMIFGSLDRISLTDLTAQEWLLVIQQVIGCLDALHSLDIQHGDVNPRNILIESWRPLNIRLADYGQAVLPNVEKQMRYHADEDYSSVFRHLIRPIMQSANSDTIMPILTRLERMQPFSFHDGPRLLSLFPKA